MRKRALPVVISCFLSADILRAEAADAVAGMYADPVIDFSCGAESSLANPQQFAFEKRIRGVLNDPEIQRAIGRVEDLYRNDAVASTPSGERRIASAARSITAAMVEWGLLMSSPAGTLVWTAKAAHRWAGLPIPNSGYGIENPDNVYRHMRIDPALGYEIRGRLGAHAPEQQSFIVYAGYPGTGALSKEGAGLVGMLDQVISSTDGETFVVTLDTRPANGRPNHIQLDASARLLIVRDSLADWRRQRPNPLTVTVQGTPEEGDDAENALAHTLRLLDTVPAFWVDYDNRYIYSRPPNVVATPRVRGSGWGASISGHFQIDPGVALAITLQQMDAAYLGFQLADPWGVGLEYVNRSGSLNNHQVQHNDDGTITYIISAEDPGHPNWLDTSGLDSGIFAIRWQAFAEPVKTMESAVVSVERISVADLSTGVPTYSQTSAVARYESLAQRRADFLFRMGCEH